MRPPEDVRLLGETAPDRRTGPLITLVTALHAIPLVVDDSTAAWDRAEEIAEGDWPGGAEALTVAELCLASVRYWHLQS